MDAESVEVVLKMMEMVGIKEHQMMENGGPKLSFKETFLGRQTGLSGEDDAYDGFVSESDEVYKDEDEEHCPKICLIRAEKARLWNPRRQTLIIKVLSRTVGEKIGRPIRIKQATDQVSRVKFAHLCVELDITKPLLAKFKLRRRTWRIEYEGIHFICFQCGVYGHRKELCLENQTFVQPKNEPVKKGVTEMVNGQIGKENEIRQEVNVNAVIVESYALVGRKSRKGNNRRKLRDGQNSLHENRKVSMQETNAINGGAFALLATDVDQGEVGEHNRPGKSVGPSNTKDLNVGLSRKAAAEEEHTLVLATQKGKNVTKEVINNVSDMNFATEGFSLVNNDVFEHHQDPPGSLAEDADDGMSFEDGSIGNESLGDELLG
ncbi:hypothetical protein PTKIN_Ptkin04bG0019700 [Pterospermum kingtungense]